MLRRLVLLVAALLILPDTPGVAQEQEGPEFTLESIHASSTFRPKTFRGGKWADQGPVITYIESADTADATHLMRYNLKTEERTQVIDGTNLYAEDVDRIVPIEGYTFSDGGEKVLIYTDSKEVWRANTKGYYYVYDLGAQTLTPISDRDRGYQMFAKFNPSATKVAFVRKRDLHVVNLATGTETALTTDGSEGKIINGTFDWVYEEEFGLRDGWRWSPDGSHIAFFKLDESETRSFPLMDNTKRYPKITRFRYPKAGEKNSEIKIGVVDLSKVDTSEAGQPQAVRYFDTKTWDPGLSKKEEASDPHEYLARIGWTPKIGGQHRVWMFRLNREQNDLDLLYGDPTTGDVTRVLHETRDTYIDITNDKLSFLDDGKHFIFLSERSGYNHAYLYRNDGTKVGPVTEGDWEVTQFHGIDEKNGTAYFTATRDTSIERHLYRAEVSMAPHEAAPPARKVTTRPGWHAINLSKDLSYYIDQYSASGTPPTWTLHETNGDRLTTLQGNKVLKQRLDSLDLPRRRFTSLPAADGTPLNAYVIKPTDFDPSEKYPVLMYVYGGPGVQTVTDRWGGSRQLWHQYLARTHDVVVVSVDNRGTGGRGKAFQDVPYQRLGQPESADQIHAAQALADSAWVDRDRIGIWGWSYGGYMTLLSMLREEGPSTFDTGLSIAPVTDWRLYDTIYTERYMSTPQRNEDGYEKGAPLAYADRLRADQSLLMVHGDDDDNVHFQNSVQMVNQLQEANKQFQFMMYPTHEHGLAGGKTRLNLFTMLTDTITEHLLPTPETSPGQPEPTTER
ncbi:MAG: S9 family peptidase [Salinibacter sp.]|uniref:S9 family peptidase n=1 Tax=Salinibacter sp. TaxID=2065818 RepID=UPI0035D4D783